MTKKSETKTLIKAIQSWVEEVPPHRWLPSDQAVFEQIKTMINSFAPLLAALRRATEACEAHATGGKIDYDWIGEARAAIALAERTKP